MNTGNVAQTVTAGSANPVDKPEAVTPEPAQKTAPTQSAAQNAAPSAPSPAASPASSAAPAATPSNPPAGNAATAQVAPKPEPAKPEPAKPVAAAAASAAAPASAPAAAPKPPVSPPPAAPAAAAKPPSPPAAAAPPLPPAAGAPKPAAPAQPAAAPAAKAPPAPPAAKPPAAPAPATPAAKPAAPPPAAAAQAAAPAPAPASPPEWRPAGLARIKPRHLALAASFLLLVVAPLLLATFYLFAVARDQYASRVAFTVRKAEVSSTVELLGGITKLAGSGGGGEADILYEYLQSPNAVRAVNARIDLVRAFSRPGDPVFTLGSDTRIEAMTDYWRRMVKINFDSSTRLFEIRVAAFAPEDAQAIATAIHEESTRMINDLSASARDEATRFAQEEMTRSLDRLKTARTQMTAFRAENQIVDPSADVQGQMVLINTLQDRLAATLIELDLLLQSAAENDPRVVSLRQRVKVIRDRIRTERTQFSDSSDDEDPRAFPELVGRYESLAVDQAFAEKSYVAALAGYDSAVADAQRKSLYLATYMPPTLAETAELPKRGILLATLGGILLVAWSILAMIYYSLRDRR